MEYNYTTIAPGSHPYECTLSPGDVIYFPDMWWHATINVDSNTAFVSTFTQEHLFLDDKPIGKLEVPSNLVVGEKY